MKPNHARRNRQGITFIEILICLVVLAVLLGLLLPALSKAKSGGRINCVNNLQQVGLALRMWSTDNGEKFPWQISTNRGGTVELISSGDAFRQFLAISNEANTPKIFLCPADLSSKTRAVNWDQFVNDTNVSYFIGLDASEVYPQTILSGDRNLSTSSKLLSGLVLLMTNAPLQWANGLHAPAGNVGLGDGSVQQMTAKMVLAQRAKDTNSAIRAVFP